MRSPRPAELCRLPGGRMGVTRGRLPIRSTGRRSALSLSGVSRQPPGSTQVPTASYSRADPGELAPGELSRAGPVGWRRTGSLSARVEPSAGYDDAARALV